MKNFIILETENCKFYSPTYRGIIANSKIDLISECIRIRN